MIARSIKFQEPLGEYECIWPDTIDVAKEAGWIACQEFLAEQMLAMQRIDPEDVQYLLAISDANCPYGERGERNRDEPRMIQLQDRNDREEE